MGLSVELWIVLNVFLTIWPFAPFAPFLFSLLNISVVFIVNAKVSLGCLDMLAPAVLTSHSIKNPPFASCLLSHHSCACQLVHVIRFASRGGTAKRLENDIFWFKRPALLLHPVKMVCADPATPCRPCQAHGSMWSETGQLDCAGSVPVLVPVVLACVHSLAVRRQKLLFH